MSDKPPDLTQIQERLARSRAELWATWEARPDFEIGRGSMPSGEFPRSATLRFLRNAPDHPVLTSVALSAVGLLANRIGLARLTKIIGVISLLRRLRSSVR
jgi:hypothetical protein